MKRFLLLAVAFFAVSLQAQVLNDYQYVIVPSKYDFLKHDNQYRLNTLTKMHLEKLGFKAYYDNELLPKDVAENSCNRLVLSVSENNTMFMTKLTLHFKDCMNREVFTSEEGKSREKEFEKGYIEALAGAFESIAKQEYSYNGKNGLTTGKVSAVKNGDQASTVSVKTVLSLTAKPIDNGFDLYLKDSEGSLYLFTVYRTSNPDVFIAFQKSKQGVFIRKEGQWYFESYESGKLISEPFTISGMN